MDRDRARGALHRLAAAGQLIEALSVHLHGGVHGRHLADLAAKLRKRFLQRFPRHVGFRLSEGGAGNILGIRREAEAQRGTVAFCVRFGEFHRPRGAADKHRQQPGRHRVQGSRMPDPPLPQQAAQLLNHVVAGPAGGLVNQEDPVHSCAPQSSSITSSRSFSAFSGPA